MLGDRLRELRYFASLLRYYQPPPRLKCPICGFVGAFGPYNWPPKFYSRCPQCGSLERHRLLKLWLDQNEGRLRGRRLLHIAPEACVTRMVKPLAREYVSGDVRAERAETPLNIEHLALPDQSFDAVICSHVLEHVDDRRALRELRRVLTPGGLAILMFPIVEAWPTTFENPTYSEDERALHFGQRDHLRLYGADVRSRITSAGFTLEEYTAEGPVVAECGLIPGEKLFLATASAPSRTAPHAV